MVRMVCSRWVQVRFREMLFVVRDRAGSWTQVVCEHVQLLPGAIGGIAFGRHHIESELASQFGEGFLLGPRHRVATWLSTRE